MLFFCTVFCSPFFFVLLGLGSGVVVTVRKHRVCADFWYAREGPARHGEKCFFTPTKKGQELAHKKIALGGLKHRPLLADSPRGSSCCQLIHTHSLPLFYYKALTAVVSRNLADFFSHYCLIFVKISKWTSRKLSVNSRIWVRTTENPDCPHFPLP